MKRVVFAVVLFSLLVNCGCLDNRKVASNDTSSLGSLFLKPAGVETRWSSAENWKGEKSAGGKANAGRKGSPKFTLKAEESQVLAEVKARRHHVAAVHVDEGREMRGHRLAVGENHVGPFLEIPHPEVVGVIPGPALPDGLGRDPQLGPGGPGLPQITAKRRGRDDLAVQVLEEGVDDFLGTARLLTLELNGLVDHLPGMGPGFAAVAPVFSRHGVKPHYRQSHKKAFRS